MTVRISLLSGALKNAGDYLITKRCQEIIESVIPSAEIKTYIRNKPINEDIAKIINESDCIVIGGGPCYKSDLYPQAIPLVPDLRMLTPPIFMMGCGWYGDTSFPRDVWNYQFTDSSKDLLSRVYSDSKLFGCRDYYAVKILSENGYKQSLMTGCPAWYDLSKIHTKFPNIREIKKIAVSDPADIKHFGSQSINLCKYLQKRYPFAERHYFFHRGTGVDQFTDQDTALMITKLSKQLLDMGFQIHDISYSSDGFALYNSCDLHIGHRVHAHIYNLSQRKASILLEEDSRGAGVNEALGLWGIKAYEKKRRIKTDLLSRVYKKIVDTVTVNPYAIKEVAAYLDYCEQSDYNIFRTAFSLMDLYYENMMCYMNHMRNLLEGS